MVRYFTELGFVYKFLFITIEVLIIFYLIRYCKNNYKEFTIHDMGISQSFISSCALLIGLIMDIIYLLLTVFNGHND